MKQGRREGRRKRRNGYYGCGSEGAENKRRREAISIWFWIWLWEHSERTFLLSQHSLGRERLYLWSDDTNICSTENEPVPPFPSNLTLLTRSLSCSCLVSPLPNPYSIIPIYLSQCTLPSIPIIKLPILKSLLFLSFFLPSV